MMTSKSTLKKLIALAAAGWAGGMVAIAAGPDDLEGLVRQWVALRTDVAIERAAWTEQEQALRREIDLLRIERDTLAAEAAAFTAESSAHAERWVAEAARHTAQVKAMDGVLPALERTEAALRNWPGRLPPDVRADTERHFRELPVAGPDARPTRPAERLQRVFALMTRIETQQQQIHLAREMIEAGEGPRRMADVVYIGLARAFAVSPDGAWAAVGSPGEAGWTWTVQPEWASAIRPLVSMVQKQQVAGWVHLPLQVRGHE